MTNHQSVWTEFRVMRLKALWAKGLTAYMIARELGLSRNQVIGKAHRLGLDSRPSPIRRGQGSAIVWTPEMLTEMRNLWQTNMAIDDIASRVGVARATLCGKAKAIGLGVRPTSIKVNRPTKPKTAAPIPFLHRSAPVQDSRNVRFPELKRGECQYATNNAAAPGDHRFCGAPTLPGRPWCEGHAVICRGKLAADQRQEQEGEGAIAA